MFSFEKENENEDEVECDYDYENEINAVKKSLSIRRKKSSFILNDLTAEIIKSSVNGDVAKNNNNNNNLEKSQPSEKKPANIHVSENSSCYGSISTLDFVLTRSLSPHFIFSSLLLFCFSRSIKPFTVTPFLKKFAQKMYKTPKIESYTL